MTEMARDSRWMALALSLGRRGLGRVWPSPAVGCVIVKADQVIGRGWTGDGGTPHAETRALAQAGAQAKGAVAYVTLEPCSHHGRTPPCADALIAAGIARVVVATADPDPKVNGQGLARLRAAGIIVETGLCEAEARRDHAGFFNRILHNRPFLTLKLASSFDGRIATSSGESQWITGPEARRMVHVLRARHDAVLIGAATARADDPGLDVRGLGMARQPVRVVISRNLDLPPEGKLAASAQTQPVWICHGAGVAPATLKEWQDRGAETLDCGPAPENVDVSRAMERLAEKGLTRVFCEGGGKLAASLLEAGLVDQLIGFSAGLVLGAQGLPGVAGLNVPRLQDAPRFELQECHPLGGDLMHVWQRTSPKNK